MSYSSLSVLVVSDNSFNIKLIKSILMQTGVIHVAAVTDYMTLFEALNEEKFDIILLEWELKDEDSRYLLEFLKSDEGKELSKAPVIVATSRANRAMIIDAVKSGADDILAKPISVKMMRERIQRTLEKSKPTGKRSPRRVQQMSEDTSSFDTVVL